MSSYKQVNQRINLVLPFSLGLLAALALVAAANASQERGVETIAPSGVIDLWGGGSESVALRGDGTVWTWGYGAYGVLGNGHGATQYYTGTEYDSWIPFQVLGPGGVGHLSDISAIAGGEHHNVALDANGELWTWGLASFGQLGLGDLPDCTSHAMDDLDCMRTTPVKIPNFTAVKAVATRGYHTLALKEDGTVLAWGYNDSGRLGDGSNIDRFSPVPVVGLTGTVHGKVIALSSGGAVNAALMEDHTLMAWGNNEYGAVGNGTTSTTGQWIPVEVSQASGLTNVKAIATGWDHMVALAEDGTVWTWGANAWGQLGNGSKGYASNSSVPYHVSGLSNIVGVSAGDGSTVVLTADGHVWAWGTLRIGDGCCTSYYYGPTPVQVAGIDRVTLVRARDWHVLALKSDGSVWAWGYNWKGQIGDGTVGGDKTTPVRVLFPGFLTQPLFLPILTR
jgi:alpha-tubulin suppressor-like RCC1 family protein